MENVQFSRKSDSAGKTGEKDRVKVVTDVSVFWRLIIWNNRLIVGRSERLMSAISISLHASHAFKVIFSKVSVFSSWKTRAEAAGCLFGALNPETSVFVRLRSAQLSFRLRHKHVSKMWFATLWWTPTCETWKPAILLVKRKRSSLPPLLLSFALIPCFHNSRWDQPEIGV